MQVISEGKGEIILGRRLEARSDTFDHTEYGPCPNCLEWIKRKFISRHQVHCPGADKSIHNSRSLLLTQSDALSGRISNTASNILVKEVFAVMQQDDIGKVAKADPLIIAVGNNWMDKMRGNTLNRKYYTSGIMRLLGKFLINLRRQAVDQLEVNSRSDANTLSDYIRPQHFDKCINAALECAAQDADDMDDMASPSNAIKLGYELKRIVECQNGTCNQSKRQ